MKRPLAASVVTIVLLLSTHFGIAASEGSKRRDSVTAVDLGTMDGHFTIPTAINDRGAIVGNAFSSVSGHSVAFLWTRAHGFEKILGELEAIPFDINDRGEVIGQIVLGEFESTGFLWSPAGGLKELDAFTPAQINDRGQIAGSCLGSGPSGPTAQACLWDDGVVTAVAPFGSSAAGLNNRGHVIGQHPAEGTFKAFVWTMRNGLSVLPGPGTTSAAAINEHDEIVGNRCCVDETVAARGVVWPDEDRFRLLPVGTVLVDINDRGDMVGRRDVPVLQGFVVTRDRRTVELGDAAPVGINNRSEIAGFRSVGDEIHLVVWRFGE